jgi:predicted enzyme related to lactoylglutathione lyase
MSTAAGAAKFAFTKLVVRDLDRSVEFYRAVCGYAEPDVLKADMGSRPIAEAILRTPDGALDLVLMAYTDGALPGSSNTITAFDTSDLDSYTARVLEAGGTVVHEINAVEVGTTRMRIAFYADPDGNLLEVMER